jgi:hypothetical protein
MMSWRSLVECEGWLECFGKHHYLTLRRGSFIIPQFHVMISTVYYQFLIILIAMWRLPRDKWLLISESRDDSNRYIHCRGKSDQHVTCIPRPICVWPSTIRISRDPHIATFHEVVNNDGQSCCSREKGLLTQSTTRWLTDLWVRTQFLSRANHWNSEGKATL